MIELRLTVDKLNYNELFDVIIPLLVKNKLAEKTLKAAITVKFASMSEAEKDAAAAEFLSSNSTKITEMINGYLSNQLPSCHFSSLEAINK